MHDKKTTTEFFSIVAESACNSLHMATIFGGRLLSTVHVCVHGALARLWQQRGT